MRLDGAGSNDVPVVCLHSSMSSCRQWTPLQRQLCTRLVYCPHLAGYGPTQLPAAKQWSFDAEADFVLAQLPPAVRAAPVDMVGHSYGGALALHLVRTGKLTCRRLVLFEPVAFHLLRAAATHDQYAAQLWQQVAAFSAQLVKEAKPAAYFLDHWQGPGFFDQLPQRLQRLMTAQVCKVPLDFQALANEPADCSSYQQQLTMPVLLLAGAQSRASALYIVQLLDRSLSNVRTITVNAGHMAPLTDPELVFPTVSAFLQD